MRRPSFFVYFYSHGKGGNALFLILIAVALFAALSYAITQSGRGGGGSIDREKAQLAAALAEQCVGYVEHGVNKLTLLNGCAANQVSYELPNGANENPANTSNTSCFVFHADGADLTPCGIYLSVTCDSELATLNIGQTGCGGTIVYAGISGGNRIYTTLADQLPKSWDADTGWHNEVTGATSVSDGLANTDTLVARTNPPYNSAPHHAALACRALGSAWYLPSKNELQLLYDNSETGALDGTFDYTPGTSYWSSTETAAFEASSLFFLDGEDESPQTNETHFVRCVRR